MGKQFVPYVADNLDDAGLGNAIALDKDGVPFVSYLIFPARRGRRAPSPSHDRSGRRSSRRAATIRRRRRGGSRELSDDGVWTRGAAAQVPVAQAPAGITVPYGPDTVDSLVGATADNTNGTDIAIDATARKHVVWAGPDGIWYAGGTTSFAKRNRSTTWSPPLDHAGPIGRPSVAVDAENHPWVAYAIDSPNGQEIRVATNPAAPSGRTQVAAKIPYCQGCPQPGPVRDRRDAERSPRRLRGRRERRRDGSRLAGAKWTTEIVEAGIAPSGLSLAIGKDGTPWVTYYTGDGAVNLATTSGAGWTTAKVADAKPGDGTDNQAETTGVAMTDDGTIYVAWYDAAKNAVSLASGRRRHASKPIETHGHARAVRSRRSRSPPTGPACSWPGTTRRRRTPGRGPGRCDGRRGRRSRAPRRRRRRPSLAHADGDVSEGRDLQLAAPAGAAASGFAETTLTAKAEHRHHDLLRQPGPRRAAQRRRLRRPRRGRHLDRAGNIFRGRRWSSWTCRAAGRARTSTSATSTPRP